METVAVHPLTYFAPSLAEARSGYHGDFHRGCAMFRCFGLFIASALVVLPAAAQTGRYASFVAKSKAVITEGMYDPEGARFRKLTVHMDTVEKKLVLCGEINPRNGFGGHVGYRKFFADAIGGVTQDGDDDQNFGRLYASYCRNKIADVK